MNSSFLISLVYANLCYGSKGQQIQDIQVVECIILSFRPRLHYTGLHRSVAIFIPDSATVYTTPQ